MNIPIDRHMNLFWNYEGKPSLENNITRAFISTIRLLSEGDRKAIIRFLSSKRIIFDDEEYAFTFGLQSCPLEPTDFPLRHLVGISPTGRKWSDLLSKQFKKDGLKDLKTLLEQKPERIKEGLKELDLKIEPSSYEAVRQDISILQSRGNSIPDAWIFIHKSGKPYACLAIENKLWDLDPYQLRNHMQKSLHLEKDFDKSETVLSYFDVYNFLEKTSASAVRDDFLDFLYYLNYQPLRPFARSDFDFSLQDNNAETVLKRKWSLFFEQLKEKNPSFKPCSGYIRYPGNTCGNILIEPVPQNLLKGKEHVLAVSSEIGVDNRDIMNEITKLSAKSIDPVAKVYANISKTESWLWCRFTGAGGRNSAYTDLALFQTPGKLFSFLEDKETGKTSASRKECLSLLAEYNRASDAVRTWKFSQWHYSLYIRMITYLYVSDVTVPLDDLSKKISRLTDQHGKALDLLQSLLTQNSRRNSQERLRHRPVHTPGS